MELLEIDLDFSYLMTLVVVSLNWFELQHIVYHTAICKSIVGAKNEEKNCALKKNAITVRFSFLRKIILPKLPIE